MRSRKEANTWRYNFFPTNMDSKTAPLPKISIYETVLCDLTIYWMVTYSFVVVIYIPSYKLLGTEHFITDGGERGGFGIHQCSLL
jgi:hypothetical protein